MSRTADVPPAVIGARASLRTVVACLAVVLLGAAARFWLAWTAPPSEDLASYGIVVDLLRDGQPLYAGTHRYNYGPVWSWVLAGVAASASATGLSFVGLTRSLLAAGDLGLAAIVFRLARRTGVVAPWPAAAIVAANPVLIWVSSVQGQFDNLAVLLLLGALLLPTARRAAPLLWLSIAVKHVAAVHPLLWWKRRSDAVWVLAVYAGAAALFLPYRAQWRSIRDHVVFYRSVPRSFGFSELVLDDARWALPLTALALCAASAAAWRLRFHEPARAALFVFLVLLFFAPGMGAQYFVWVLAPGALFAGAGYVLTTAAALAWILGSHYGWPGSGQFLGQLAWLGVAFWGVREARALGASMGR
jgi:hypothetical protein